jgi:hypothetical protein
MDKHSNNKSVGAQTANRFGFLVEGDKHKIGQYP